MSDGVPTDEQLARIQLGVTARIRRRRSIGRGITGSAVAVLLLGGGFALLPRVVGGASSGTAAGGSAASAASSAEQIAVRCHDSAAKDSTSVTRTATGPLPAAAIRACGPIADFQSGQGRMPTATGSPGPTASAPAPEEQATSPSAAVCRAPDGVLHVYPVRPAEAATLCDRYGYTRD